MFVYIPTRPPPFGAFPRKDRLKKFTKKNYHKAGDRTFDSSFRSYLLDSSLNQSLSLSLFCLIYCISAMYSSFTLVVQLSVSRGPALVLSVGIAATSSLISAILEIRMVCGV